MQSSGRVQEEEEKVDGHLPGKEANREQEDPEDGEDLKKKSIKKTKKILSTYLRSGRGGRSR